jgi:murein DD-endopeptidase MepM/ murein hydrolase activator NlpD
LFKIINKIKIGIKRAQKTLNFKGLHKNPYFYFGLISFILFFVLCSWCDSSASFNGLKDSRIVFLNSPSSDVSSKGDLFLTKSDGAQLETPDLKIIQDNTIGGVSTPHIVSTKTLGDVFGSSSQSKKDVTEYAVQPGDSLQSIATANGISLNTLLWANDLTNSSKVKVGQSLVILPVDGILYIVKSGDTTGAIAQKYKADSSDIISFNDLVNQDDIYIGDILVIPGGTMPKKASSIINNTQVPLADNFFIFPTSGRITQGLHYYNAVDTANKCGTPVYAAASGIVQRVKYGYNGGGGNIITILHTNGIVTYYGHLMTIFVKSGDRVNVGDRIALMGGGTGTVGDGLSTGCHLHFQVMGAKNPLSRYAVGATISLK